MSRVAGPPAAGADAHRAGAGTLRLRAGARAYVAITRPGHWFKQIFMLPGVGIAAALTGTPPRAFWRLAVLGLVSTCLVASANYVVNEWFDAASDRHHPEKRHRPAARGVLRGDLVCVEYVVLLAAGLALGAAISVPFVVMAAVLAAMGIVYNVEPVRAKDRVVVDVLTESVNNPIRLLLGWYIVMPGDVVPPASLVLGYWMAGAFLMDVKRYAEIRSLGRDDVRRLYRRSFGVYTEETLLIAMLFYACSAAFFLGVFLVKYRVALLVSLPFLALLFSWYLWLGMKPDSPAQHPETLWRERAFALYCVFVAILLCVLFVVDIPPLSWFLQKTFVTR